MENIKYQIRTNRYPENIIMEAWEKADKEKLIVQLVEMEELKDENKKI